MSANRFAVLDIDSDDDYEADTRSVNPLDVAVDAGYLVGFEHEPDPVSDGLWQKVDKKEMTITRADRLVKRDYSSMWRCVLREFMVKTQLRMLHQTLIQEWKEKYDYPTYETKENERTYESDMKQIGLKRKIYPNILIEHKFKQIMVTSMGEVPEFHVSELGERHRTGGYCSTCAEYETICVGWKIVVAINVNKFFAFQTIMQTRFIREIQGLSSIGMVLKDASLNTFTDLFRLGPDSSMIDIVIKLRYEIPSGYQPTNNHGYYLGYRKRCACDACSGQPRGCGREGKYGMRCCCILCGGLDYCDGHNPMECTIRTNSLEIMRRALITLTPHIRRFLYHPDGPRMAALMPKLAKIHGMK